mmetsp:Transcript_7751/g.24139  ORF Transcript_7751/g.24139 Transcript_7751/m.24139 type:complete len:220 (+) Transcript_7751:227-886(+)
MPMSPRYFSMMQLSESIDSPPSRSRCLNIAFLCRMVWTVLRVGGPQKTNGLQRCSFLIKFALFLWITTLWRLARPIDCKCLSTSLLPPWRPFRTTARVLAVLTFGGFLFFMFLTLLTSPFLCIALLTSVSGRTIRSLPFTCSFCWPRNLAMLAARCAAAFRLRSRRLSTVSATLMVSPGFRGWSTALGTPSLISICWQAAGPALRGELPIPAVLAAARA